MKNKTSLIDVEHWLRSGRLLGTFSIEHFYGKIGLATRYNGIRDDRGDCFGEADRQAACELKRAILAQYPELTVDIETCDEWVLMDIRLPVKQSKKKEHA